MVTKWDRRFLELAHVISTWSKDPSTQVGCVIVRPNRTIVSLGFNGFPRGVEDTLERLGDKLFKHECVVHAEENALLTARESVFGYTLYCSPVMPCSRCAAKIIQAGIKRVVSPPARSAGNVLNYDLTRTLFEEALVAFETSI